MDFDHAIPRMGAQVWTNLGDAGKLPRRQDFDPVSLPRSLLPHMLLIDVVYKPYRRFRWRLLGTHITSVLGRDSTGRYVDEVLPENKYHEFIMPFEWVIDKQRPLRIWGHSPHLDKDWLKFENFLAPLVDKADAINMLFGVALYGNAP